MSRADDIRFERERRRKAKADDSRRYRRRKGIQPRVLKPCGTVAAARRHERAGEPKCPACADAVREYQRESGRRGGSSSST